MQVSDASQLTCMKQVPSRQLEDAVIETNTRFSLIPDGITIFADTADRLAAGEFLNVPLLRGTTKNEADIFVVGAALSGIGVVIPNLTEILADLQTQCRCNGVFPDISTHPDIRAYHASEIPIIFGTMPAPSEKEKALSKLMQGAWVAFARDPTQGLLELGWPKYSPDTNTLAQIGNPLNQTDNF
ncbi:hypothetical protein C0995_015593 [Termitomyces sp. Mi166|nr:hypothetical protein C0995_015593 [Termitomyces sp. Mi166\